MPQPLTQALASAAERDDAAWDNPARPAFSRRRTALRKRNEQKERREDAQSKGQHLTLLEHGDAMDRWLWQAAPEMRKRVEFRATRLRTRSKARGTHSARPGNWHNRVHAVRHESDLCVVH